MSRGVIPAHDSVRAAIIAASVLALAACGEPSKVTKPAQEPMLPRLTVLTIGATPTPLDSYPVQWNQTYRWRIAGTTNHLSPLPVTIDWYEDSGSGWQQVAHHYKLVGGVFNDTLAQTFTCGQLVTTFLLKAVAMDGNSLSSGVESVPVVSPIRCRLGVSTSGPTAAQPYAAVTITANVTGGVGPYNYAWTLNGMPTCSNSSSCSNRINGPGTWTTFAVTVTSADQQTASDSHPVWACNISGSADARRISPAVLCR